MRTYCIAAVLALFATPIAGQTLTITVGTGPDCVFDNLAEAVAVAHTVPAQERLILLERGVFEGVAVISEIEQLTLRGGFLSCSDEQPAANVKTILVGTGDAPVVTVDQGVLPGVDDLPSLVLENVELSDGLGGLLVRSPARVRLENVAILGNEAPFGAGIRIEAFPSLVDVELIRTSVNGNRTLPGAVSDGGGVHCNGLGFVRMRTGSAVIGNSALGGGHGGGFFLDGCELDIEGDVNIQLNSAHRGGAIAAVDGAAVRLLADASGVPELAFNRADEHDGVAGHGGAVHLARGSSLDSDASRWSNNRALPESASQSRGGALFLDDSTAELANQQGPCDPSCLELADNRSAEGAAVFAANGSRVDLVRAHIDANAGEDSVLRADSGAPGANSRLMIVSSFLSRNAASDLLQVNGGSALDLKHISVGGHPGLGTVIRARDISSVQIQSSVLFEPSAFLLNPGDSVALSASCNVVSDDTFFQNGSAQELDPLFRDATLGDLHLEEGSPAIDICEPVAGLVADIDGQPRTSDLVQVPDDNTPADAGADEVLLLEPPLFADDFESGRLTAWSQVVGST